MLAAEEEMAVARIGCGRGFDGFEHQGRSVDPVGELFVGRELSVERPDERHPVRGD